MKPTGSKDVLSFGPTEVTLTKPARKDAAAGVKPKSATRKDSTVTMPSPAAAPATPPSEPVSPPAPKAEAPQPSSAPAPAAKPAGGAAPAPAKKSAPAAAKKAKAPEVTVTLLGTADGEWTVEVVAGKKRTKGLPVPSSAVSQAAKLLHPEVAEVVDGVLESVRASQRAKVEALQAELESARKLLDELAG
ncbi:DUF6319 family protein [Nocardia yamanashiensis]|uniref:DUF6319 family protein n=1 Tax=Nocardia yamanashiensis TaxID=209247 RepID=UPI0022B8324D|nr:DUF6319 family protein [Nocardia yamanashiensis]